MFHAADVLHLQEGETIEAISRRHAATLVPGLLAAALLIVVPFFFLFALLRSGPFGIIAFCLSLAFGIVLAYKTFHTWDAGVLLLTNRRLIHVNQRGLWTRIVSEMPLALIQRVECERSGLGDAICRTSNLRVFADGATGTIEFARLPKAERFVSRLNEVRAPG